MTATLPVELAGEGFSSWPHPLQNSQILIDRGTLQLLSTAALNGHKEDPPSEIGGWLWGHFNLSNAGKRYPVIARAELVRSEGTLHNATAGDAAQLARALQVGKSNSSLSIVGYFRSHIREGLCLTSQDQKVIERYTRDPDSVFLVIKPFDIGICTAGFFFWQNERLQMDASDLEIPLVAFPEAQPEQRLKDVERSGNKMLTNNGESDAPGPHFSNQPINTLASSVTSADRDSQTVNRRILDHHPATRSVMPAHTGESDSGPYKKAAGKKRRVSWLVLLPIVLGVVCGVGLRFVFRAPRVVVTMPDNSAQTEIGLRVRRTSDGQLDVSWDRDAPAIRNSTRAVLGVKDGSVEQKWDLNPAQLRSATVAYFPNSNSVQFHLEFFLDAKRSVAESLYVLSPLNGAGGAAALLPSRTNVKVHSPAESPVVTPVGDRPAESHPEPNVGTRSLSSLPLHLVPPKAFTPNRVDERIAPPDLKSVLNQNPDPVLQAVAAAPTGRLPEQFAMPEAKQEKFVAQRPGSQVVNVPTTPTPTQSTDTVRPGTQELYVAPRPIRKVSPETQGLGLMYDSSEVAVEVNVDSRGHVSRARTAESKQATSAMIASAMTAARRWIFEPARLHGKSVETEYTIVFEFHAERR